jgi:phospholipid-translocating ATPase
MKARDGVITLAIGDGANDCNMIRSADVGIGLRGQEGLQAFNVCDYGISQFRFLQYLLLVHGRWAYRRITKLVLYMFYKNIVVVGPQFFYALTNGFSGQKLYHDLMYQSYNVFFTAAPILVFGILDQDVSREMSLRYPFLYEIGRKKLYFNNRVFVQWMVCGLWHSLVVFIIPYFALSNGAITFSDGRSNDIWLVGTIVFLLVIVVANAKVVVETVHVSVFVYIGLFLSFFAWLGMQAFLSGASGKITSSVATELFGSTSRILGSPVCWLVIIASTIIATIRDWQWKAVDIIRGEDLAGLYEVQAQMLKERYAGPAKKT